MTDGHRQGGDTGDDATGANGHIVDVAADVTRGPLTHGSFRNSFVGWGQ